MKRLHYFLLGAACVAQSALAVPADPEPKVVTQPDGSTLTVQIRGDERANMLFTVDDIPLFYNKSSKAFEYATISNGCLSGSGIVAADLSKRDASATKWLDEQNRAEVIEKAISSKKSRNREAQRSDFLIGDYPTLGKQRTLAILVQFSDVKFESMSDPYQFYYDMLNKEGFTHENGANGSARDFYLQTSMGAFDPEFDVYGPVTLSREATYYGKDDPSQDSNMGDFLTEVLEIADKDIDFSKYDLDNNGYIDNIFFFYAGGGQADDPNGTDYIWPHSGEADIAWGIAPELDGKIFRHYACSNELRYSSDGSKIPTGIGTFVHEFGHVLGLRDHYDTYGGVLTHHPYYWDTMASGSYNNNCHTPPLFSGFERAELGWLEYDELEPTSPGIIEIPWIGESNKAYRMKVPGADNEFYVFENRQLDGFDRFLPNHGMLVWHIDQDMDYWVNNKVNTDPTHQRIDIIEADKKADTSTLKGDSFPGSEQVTQFDLYAWSGDKLTAFEDVTEENNTIYLLLAGTDFQPDAPNDIKVLESDDTSVTISWSPVKYAKYYLLTVADAISGEPVGTYNDKRLLSCDAVSIPYLEAEHEYVVTVKAGIGNYLSNPATQTVQTTAVPFAKLSPQNVEVSDVTSNSFLVKWDGVRDAESYVITLTRNQYPDNTVARGYGFDDKQNGLPAMWSTSSNSFYSVSGWYGVSSPSLRFSKDGDNIIAAYPESLITSISFWCRAKSAGQKIAVDVADGENGYEALDTVDVSENGGSVTVELPESSSVKLTYLRTENFIVIDDLTLNCKVLEREPVEAYTDFAVSGADGVLIDGLTAETTYGLTVRAVNSDVYSAKSEEAVVTLLADSGVDSVGMDDASVADRGESVYDLFGRKYRTLNSVAPGIYIVNGVKRIIK